MKEKHNQTFELGEIIASIFRSTAGVEGEEYLRNLVRSIAEVLDVKIAMVCELDPAQVDRIRIRTIWQENQFGVSSVHLIAGSPCETVIRNGFCGISSDLAEEYENLAFLSGIDPQSFYGIPLIHNEMEMGLIAFVDDRPYEKGDLAEALLRLLSQRVVLEIEREKREEALRVSEAKFRDFANLMPMVVYEMDGDGYISYTNAHGLKLAAMTEEDFLAGVHIFDLFDIEQRALVQENIQMVMNNKMTKANEYTIKRKDGSRAAVRVISQPIHSEGIVVGLRGVVIDLSTEKRLEELEKASENAEKEGKSAKYLMENVKISATSLQSALEKLLSHTGDQPELNSLVRGARDTLTMMLRDIEDSHSR